MQETQKSLIATSSGGEYFSSTSKTGIDTNNVSKQIGNIVKQFIGKIFKASDFIEVVHLVDTDGAFIVDSQIVKKTPDIPIDSNKPFKPFYSDNQIFVDNIEAIRQRNLQKSAILNRIISLKNVWKTIPYSIYFFSCNLDHVMHGERNLLEKDKFIFAEQYVASAGRSMSVRP